MAERNAPTPSKHRRLRLVPLFSALAAVITSGLVIQRITLQPRTDDAEVFANFIGIAPLVEGPVVQLAVHDNQFVKEGDLLFAIDDAPYAYALENAKSQQAALEGQISNEGRQIASQKSAALAARAATRRAQATIVQAEAAVNQGRADVKHSQAAVSQAAAEFAYANNNFHRLEPLLSRQFVTVDQVDQSRTAARAREEALQQAKAQLSLSNARLESALAQQQQSVANLDQSQAEAIQSERAVNILDPLIAQRGSRAAAVRTAQYNFDHCRIYAPFNARVTNLIISHGAYAHVGQRLFTLIDTRTWWVVANFRETQLRRIAPGTGVDVYLMSKAETHLSGVVDSVGFGVTPDPDVVGTITEGLPNAQRTLNWVHLASRYPVRIRISEPPPNLLRIGQNAVVIIRNPFRAFP